MTPGEVTTSGRRAARGARFAGAASLVAIPVFFALAGPWLVGSAPTTSQAPFGPSSWSLFGTDRLGRDVLAAALTGGRSIVLVTSVTVVVTYAVGFVLGVVAASTRHTWLEDLIMRPIDVLLCLPSLLIIIVAALHGRGSTAVVAVAVGVASLAPITRFVRMAARGALHGPMMDALILQGAGWWTRNVRVGARLLSRPVAADLGVRAASMIYILASANFLGLGFDTTSTDWAVAVAANKDALLIAPWSVLLPAGLIVSLVLGINLLWDEVLSDPRSVAVRQALRGAAQETSAVAAQPAPSPSEEVAQTGSPAPHASGLKRLDDVPPDAVAVLRGVHTAIGPINIVAGVDLDVRAGKVTTLVGPSGSGKTTVASIVAGEPAAGLLVTGRARLPSQLGQRVALLPQQAGETLNPARRIGTVLAELLERQRHRAGEHRRFRPVGWAQRTAAVEALLVEVGFTAAETGGMLRRYPWQFSGGQRQRLALAQALTVDPRLVVLDEPTVGLDPVARDAVLEQIELLRAQGRGVLLITHDPDVAARASDVIVRMRDGRVVETTTRDARPCPPGAAHEQALGAPANPRSPLGGAGTGPATAPEALASVAALQRVSLRYGPVVALDEVSLTVGPAQIVGLCGLSGSGKSTVARVLVGLEVPNSGRVLIEGRTAGRATSRTRAQKANVQYVWQEAPASFLPYARVLDQCVDAIVRLRGLSRPDAEKRVLDLVGGVGLTRAQVRRLPAGLSGGQLQRVALVRSLAVQPTLLVCDEVTTALDPDNSQIVMESIGSYCARARSAALLISHDVPALHRHADFVLLIEEGRLHGPPWPDRGPLVPLFGRW